MAGKRVGPSEFERSGPAKSGVFGRSKAWEKLRLIVRIEQTPDGADINATPDKWKHGGLEHPTDKL